MTVRLAKSAGLVSLATLSSRAFGVVRDGVLSRFFGAGAEMDAFNIATRIPTLLRELFAEGAMSAAFVPTFTRRLTAGGKPDAWRLGSLMLNALLVTTGILVVAGMVFARPIVGLYASDYGGQPIGVAGYVDKLDLTIALTRITMPFLTVIALAAAMMGMLNAVGRFFIPAFAPATFNIVLSASAVVSGLWGRALGYEPILGVAVGFVLGGAAQMLVQWPSLRREGFRHEWTLQFDDRGLHEVARLMGPGTIGQAGAQVNLFVNTILATGQGDGAVTWLNNAFRLMYLPIGIFGVSVATATLPDLARHAARGAHDDMRSTLSWGLRLMLMLSVPAGLGLIALAYPIVQLVFEGGRFEVTDTQAVAAALLCYAPGLIGYSTVKIVSPSFYALGDPTTPMYASLGSVLLNVILNITLVHYLGYLGLALGTTVAATLNAGVLVFLLSRRIGGLDGARVLRSFAKILIASMVMAVAAHGVEIWLRDVLPATWWFTALRVAIGVTTGIGVLALMALILRIDEFRIAMSRVLGRFRG